MSHDTPAIPFLDVRSAYLELKAEIDTAVSRVLDSGSYILGSEVEVYIGPAAEQGALFYASHVEFGTVVAPAQPYMRPAWESTKDDALRLIQQGLKIEIGKAAARAERRAAKLAAGG